jgi:hypothetical protein
VLGQPFVGGVRLGREDQFGQLVLQAAAAAAKLYVEAIRAY